VSVLESTTLNPEGTAAAPSLSALASVLVIDDEEIVGNAVSALLNSQGFDVVVVRSGQEGVEVLRRRHIEVAIADLVMPGLDGIRTISALKEVDPNIEVIVLTAHVTAGSAIAALRQGACDFLQKPTRIAELRPAVVQAMEKRRAKLSRLDTRIRAIIDTAQEAIVLFDREGVVWEFNPRAEQIFGWSREQVVGRKLGDFAIPPKLLDAFRTHVEAAYRDGKAPHDGCIEVVALRQNGEEFPFEISTSAVETPGGKLLSTFGRDVTDRKQAEKATRESEAKLQVIFDGVEAGIFLIDPKTHRIVDVNPPALKLVGADRDAVIGSICHRFVCPAECGHCPATDLAQQVDNSNAFY